MKVKRIRQKGCKNCFSYTLSSNVIIRKAGSKKSKRCNCGSKKRCSCR